jgi:hypothetical protein
MAQEFDEMRELMKEPRNRLCIALHEAGHVRYGLRAGAVDVKYHGPVEYPGRPGIFGVAAVEMVFPESGTSVDIIAIARWLCAGGVVKRILMPDFWVDDEDSTDYDVFIDEYISRVPEQVLGGLTREAYAKTFWQQGQQDVERDLRSPSFRREMWELARDVEGKIPWEG